MTEQLMWYAETLPAFLIVTLIFIIGDLIFQYTTAIPSLSDGGGVPPLIPWVENGDQHTFLCCVKSVESILC